MSHLGFTSIDELAPHSGELSHIRQHLHQHPELGFQELQTSDLVASKLKQWGWDVTRGVGKTGVVGTLKIGNSHRKIGIRADMDALPILEKTGLPYASVEPGKMHACGHDGHTTMLLGAARHLAATRRFNGTAHLYFQPAEELGKAGGARSMIADGLFERFPCDAVFGMHNHPGVTTGTFLFRRGPFMAASDKVYVHIDGVGGHAARPHLCVDPVVVAASITMALQTIVSRNVDPSQPAVVTVGALQVGETHNVIPSFAKMQLSVRSFNDEIRSVMERRIRELIQSQAESFGAKASVDYVHGPDVVVNTIEETDFAIAVAKELVGDEHVNTHADLVMASEDFSFMLQQRPGTYLRLGNGTGKRGCSVHNPLYDFNDENLPIGAAFWARLVERYLAH
ncbi:MULTISPECIES: M20 aminoacylase family protein [unclassified Caballeronia]|uniref:M20 aminoacylase family protein n=1 Tax=unclassified Caballeronia TaxID=2646786 RepID=UPI00025BC322|nr:MULTISPECIES: M20 aminoacylase family protein [unclassified Caballeronia]EKS70243.1 hippurate hydrolase [Burkholderia sp. SJ98]MCE4546485.1 M20 family metallopeptidase [Caballeronia sp. PC1]MCE4573041.1 M20 family metallopeptidase [Caballeronia sp. CLC5]